MPKAHVADRTFKPITDDRRLCMQCNSRVGKKRVIWGDGEVWKVCGKCKRKIEKQHQAK